MHEKLIKEMQQPVKVVVALGSNVQQKEHIQQAIDLLKLTFDKMEFSQPMWTEPIGLPHSDKFLNVVGVGYTRSGLKRVGLALKNIEHKCGRSNSACKLGVVAMDVDLLLYGDDKYHEADWQREYIQAAMKELIWG